MQWQWHIVIGLISVHWTTTCNSQTVNEATTTSTPNGSVIYKTVATTQLQDINLNVTVAWMSTNRNSKPAHNESIHQTQTVPSSNVTALDSVNTTNRSTMEKFEWKFCTYYPIPENQYKEDCCKHIYQVYAARWAAGSYYLVNILEQLQRWKCVQFDIECRRPTWPFTDYTRHMYDLFCRRNMIEKTCYNIVFDTSQQYQFQPIFNVTWKTLIETLDSRRMRFSDLTKPCVQVALYDRKDGGVGRFHEVTEVFVPFCGLQWQGYDYNTAVFREVSPWTGMSLWCRSSVIICMIVIAVAGVITTVCNLLVLVVFGTTPRLRNSQAIYKISLGAADLMVGVVIWPNMIVLQYLTFWAPRTMGPFVKYPYAKSEEMNPYDNPNLAYRYRGGAFRDLFPTEYVRAIGFLTMLSLMVSIYTLMVASFDRFWAVFKPLRYNRFNAKRQAIILSAVVWAVSSLVCLIPTFTPGFEYNVTAAHFINVDGDEALAFVFVSLILPLIVTWVITVMTFQTSRKHARARQKIVSTTASSSDSLERRLAKTLSIMVGAFTISVLPSLSCAVAGIASPVTSWSYPLSLDLTAATAYTTSEYLAIIVLTSNSLWNFLIYSYRTRGFRDVASEVMKKFCEKTGIEYLRRGAMQVVSGARRVSLSTMMNMRRFSAPDTSDSRKKSITSLTATSKVTDSNGRPSADKDSSTFGSSSIDTDSSSKYSKSATKVSKGKSGVEIKAERKKAMKKQDSEEYVGEDSTFGSFAINAGTDRLFESVMENVPEEIETAPDESVKT